MIGKKLLQQTKKHKISLPVTKQKSINVQKEAPPCIRIEGSYTVEATVILPLFAGFMVVLLFFFRALQVQQQVGNALMATGRELAVLSYEEQHGKDVAGLPAAELLFLKNLEQNETTDAFVWGGKLAISLARSDFSGDYVELTADYSLRLPMGLFGKVKFPVTQRVKCRKWTGSTAKTAENGEEIVYITPNGEAYHKNKDCSYLKLSVKPVKGSKISECRNADGEKYIRCSKCTAKNKTYGMVYITDYGNQYHSKVDCVRLKRTIIAIRLSEVGQRHACGKCSEICKS